MKGLAEKISDSELELMDVLWRAGEPMPIAAIRTELEKRRDWDSSTVKTLLRRLCEKGAVELERRGMYRAVITQAQYGRWSARHLVDQVFNGSAKKLVASLLSDGQLSQAEIAELSALFHQEEST